MHMPWACKATTAAALNCCSVHGHDVLELTKKALVRLGRGRLGVRIHLQQQAQAAPVQGQAGADQLHAAIGLQIAPVDEDDRLRAGAEHSRCGAALPSSRSMHLTRWRTAVSVPRARARLDKVWLRAFTLSQGKMMI